MSYVLGRHIYNTHTHKYTRTHTYIGTSDAVTDAVTEERKDADTDAVNRTSGNLGTSVTAVTDAVTDVTDAAMDNRGSRVRPGNCASLIYTSGTTGPPKACMIRWVTQSYVLCTLIHI
jgi:long-subunit acyl-CoA synthetase (AMP-forming)